MFNISLQYKSIEDNFSPLLYFEEHHVIYGVNPGLYLSLL